VESRTGYAHRLSGSFIAKTIKSLPFQPAHCYIQNPEF